MNNKTSDVCADCASKAAQPDMQGGVESTHLALRDREGSEAIARMVKSQLERFLFSGDEESLLWQVGA